MNILPIHKKNKNKEANQEDKPWLTKKMLRNTAFGWIFIAGIYLGSLYLPNVLYIPPIRKILKIGEWKIKVDDVWQFIAQDNRPLTQEKSRENLDEFKDVFEILFIPLGLIGLGYTYVRSRDEIDRNKKKAAHELVIKTLDRVYDIRGKFNDISFSAKHLETLDTQQKNHINHLLNILEEICISIHEKIIHEETVNSNLIYILAEQRFLFANYIEEQRKNCGLKSKYSSEEYSSEDIEEQRDNPGEESKSSLEEKYLLWGYLTTKIDGIANSNNTDDKAVKIVKQIKANITNQSKPSVKIIKLDFTTPDSLEKTRIENALITIIDKLNQRYKDDVLDIFLFQQSESVDSLIKFIVIYLKSDSQLIINFPLIETIKDSLSFYKNKNCQVVKESCVETAYYIGSTRVDKMSNSY